jgi:hypothetical protein
MLWPFLCSTDDTASTGPRQPPRALYNAFLIFYQYIQSRQYGEILELAFCGQTLPVIFALRRARRVYVGRYRMYG